MAIDLARLFSEDGGERYIISRYPDAAQSFKNDTRKFSIREERTPSCSLKRMPSGEWGVTDFGGDSKWRNAIQIAMLEDGLDYGPALRQVCEFYNYQDDTVNFQPKPRYEERPALPDEADGDKTVSTKELTVAEMRTILTDNAWIALAKDDDPKKQEEKREQAARQLFALYHFKSVEYYTGVFNGKHLTTYSTDDYPIFCIDEGTHKKIYCPKAQKDKRFRYQGNKPKQFIHGLKQHREFVAQRKADKYKEQGEAGEFTPSAEEMAKEIEKIDVRLPEIILCSGGSDALNCAALGYRVVWLNSETATLTGDDYGALLKLCYGVYQLPDIDITGRMAGHALAVKYLDLYTIWLPDSILKVQDGKVVSKDLRDYLKTHKKKDFDRLRANALPYKFWDVEKVVDDNGIQKFKFGRPAFNYKFNHVQAYNFLYRSGFARVESERLKEGFMYVKITGNIVKVLPAQEIKNYLHKFLEERALVDDKINQDLRNAMYNTAQLSVANLANLPLLELDFKSFGPDHQYFFFPDATWKVTAEGIEEFKGVGAGMSEKYVWEDKVITPPTKPGQTVRVKKTGPLFKIWKEAETWDIQILDKSCMFLNFLINTARVHWRKELEDRPNLWASYDRPQRRDEYAAAHNLSPEEEKLFFQPRSKEQQDEYRARHKFDIAGPLLTKAEADEQKLHLVNRIYVFGFMLHRYKDASKAWCVWAMDNKLSETLGEDAKSNGGSGKSLSGKALKWIWRYHAPFSGRNPNLTKNPHIYDKVTRHTDLILIDDCHEYLDFDFFYGDITGDMNPNPKQNQSFTLPFDDSPKLWFDSNFGDRDNSESSKRRKLVTAFSDYYHENNGAYNETRGPVDDFGRKLFSDFTMDDWNYFYSFCAQALSFYLSCPEKINPPMNNIQKRNLLSGMGGRFFEWAEGYLAEDSGRLNVFLSKGDLRDKYMADEKLKDLTMQKFTGYLKKYAEYHGYILNPEEFRNSAGRIMRDFEGRKQELVLFRTRNLEESKKEAGNDLPETPEKEDDMPF